MPSGGHFHLQAGPNDIAGPRRFRGEEEADLSFGRGKSRRRQDESQQENKGRMPARTQASQKN
jgi:hypothetical protein